MEETNLCPGTNLGLFFGLNKPFQLFKMVQKH